MIAWTPAMQRISRVNLVRWKNSVADCHLASERARDAGLAHWFPVGDSKAASTTATRSSATRVRPKVPIVVREYTAPSRSAVWFKLYAPEREQTSDAWAVQVEIGGLPTTTTSTRVLGVDGFQALMLAIFFVEHRLRPYRQSLQFRDHWALGLPAMTMRGIDRKFDAWYEEAEARVTARIERALKRRHRPLIRAWKKQQRHGTGKGR